MFIKIILRRSIQLREFETRLLLLYEIIKDYLMEGVLQVIKDTNGMENCQFAIINLTAHNSNKMQKPQFDY